MQKEIWKDVFEYEGLYQVSNLGHIKSLDRIIIRIDGSKYIRYGQIMKTRIGKDGNVRINLCKDGIKRVHSLARIVYKAFNPNFDYDKINLVVAHKNNKSEDNELDNLYVVKRNGSPNLAKGLDFGQQSVICITTNKKFECMTDASKYYKVNVGSISKCCTNKQKSAGSIILDDGAEFKLIWKYLEDNI